MGEVVWCVQVMVEAVLRLVIVALLVEGGGGDGVEKFVDSGVL